MACRLSSQQLDHFNEAFRVLDTDGDGYITAIDLRLVLKSYGFTHSETDLTLFLNDLPINLEKDGAIDFPEFVLWASKLGQTLDAQQTTNKIAYEKAMRDSVDKIGVTKSDIAVRKKLEALQALRMAEQNIKAEEWYKDAKKVFAQFDKENKGWVSWDDVQTVSIELGENYSTSTLDAMMKVATKERGERHVTFELFYDLIKAETAWDEPDHYDFQKDAKADDDDDEGADGPEKKKAGWRCSIM